jgi:hypothetical protein
MKHGGKSCAQLQIQLLCLRREVGKLIGGSHILWHWRCVLAKGMRCLPVLPEMGYWQRIRPEHNGKGARPVSLSRNNLSKPEFFYLIPQGIIGNI